MKVWYQPFNPIFLFEVKIKRVNKPYTKVNKTINDGESVMSKKSATDHTPIFEVGTIPSSRISFYQV